jgi:hypothetical protein
MGKNRRKLFNLATAPSRTSPASPFSQLTYLLNIVTTINANDNLESGFHRSHHAKAKDEVSGESQPHPLNTTLLDSVVAILVQEHEVVAACFASDEISVVVAETNPCPSTSTVVDLDDTSDSDSEVPLKAGSHIFYPLQLAALSNPDFETPYNEKSTNNPHNIQILFDGNNLWEKVRDSSKWYCALM